MLHVAIFDNKQIFCSVLFCSKCISLYIFMYNRGLLYSGKFQQSDDWAANITMKRNTELETLI